MNADDDGEPIDRCLASAKDLALTLRAAHRKALIFGITRVAEQLATWAEILEACVNDPMNDAFQRYAKRQIDEAPRCVVTVPDSWVRDGLLDAALGAPCPSSPADS